MHSHDVPMMEGATAVFILLEGLEMAMVRGRRRHSATARQPYYFLAGEKGNTFWRERSIGVIWRERSIMAGNLPRVMLKFGAKLIPRDRCCRKRKEKKTMDYPSW